MRKITILLCLILLPSPCFALANFPGAEGYGTDTIGGRGGTVWVVTNTDNSGSGSLREACEASGARIVVFQTGGTINLESTITITNPYLTIAGQTAPGGGITIKRNGSSGYGFHIRTHDVVIRFISVRPGPGTSGSGSTNPIVFWDTTLGDTYNIVIDHCSLSWGTDGAGGSWYDAYDYTWSWNINSEGLHDSTHSKGPHSKGPMFGAGVTAYGDGDYLSFHHNLMAHNIERNPLIKHTGYADVVNNVSYNCMANPCILHDGWAKIYCNYEGNYHKLGSDSDATAEKQRHVQLMYNNEYSEGGYPYGYSVYLDGNIGPQRPTDDLDEDLAVRVRTGVPTPWQTDTPHSTPDITTTSAAQAYTDVLAAGGAGNSKYVTANGTWTNRRDSIDERIVDDVTNTTGSVIDDPSDVGGWDTIGAGTAWTDSDSDGIADAFEIATYGNLSQTSSGDYDGDGYTNIEEWFNGTGTTEEETRVVIIGVSIQ